MSNLITERLLLRAWRASDHEPFARMNADPRVMEFYARQLSRDESDAWIARAEEHFAQHGFGPWAVETRQTGEFIGYIGLRIPNFEAAFTPCVEIGWRLSAQQWGRGFATEGARAIVRHAFQSLGLEEIVAFATPFNLRSRRVMEKMGMTHDAADDFEDPRLPAGHWLRKQVLYRMQRAA